MQGCLSQLVAFKAGTLINCLFPQLLRQPRAQILMYYIYSPVFRAALSCPSEKIRINKGTLEFG